MPRQLGSSERVEDPGGGISGVCLEEGLVVRGGIVFERVGGGEGIQGRGWLEGELLVAVAEGGLLGGQRLWVGRGRDTSEGEGREGRVRAFRLEGRLALAVLEVLELGFIG